MHETVTLYNTFTCLQFAAQANKSIMERTNIKIAWGADNPKKQSSTNRTPLQIFHYIYYESLKFHLKMIGCSYITVADFKPNGFTYFWLSYNVSAFICMVYTVIVYDVETKWKSCALIGFCLQGTTKYFVLLHYASLVHIRIKFLKNIYTANTVISSHNYATLKRFADVIFWIQKCGVFIVFSTIVGAAFVAAYDAYNMGKPLVLMEVYLPIIDERTTLGYYSLFTYHLGICFLAINGTAACDMLIAMFVLHLEAMFEIIAHNMVQLNDALKNRARNKKRISAFLRNLIMMHKDICGWVREFVILNKY